MRTAAGYGIHSKDPDQPGIGGSSSGTIAAFTVAWERPNDFRKVLSNVGSFVNLRGGYVYPEPVLASEKKPIRIFLCDWRNDNRGMLDGAYDEKLGRLSAGLHARIHAEERLLRSLWKRIRCLQSRHLPIDFLALLACCRFDILRF